MSKVNLTETELTRIKSIVNREIDEIVNQLTDKSNIDASNINTTDYKSALGYSNIETIYDKNSSDPNINWGYTSGINNNVTVSGKDFSKYKKLLCTTYVDGMNGCGIVVVDFDYADSSSYRGSNVFNVFRENGFAATYTRVVVNRDKTTLKHECNSIWDNSTYTIANQHLFKVEGIW